MTNAQEMESTRSLTSDTNNEDPFDALLSLEDQYYREGHALGVADGSRAGRLEGRLFGIETAFTKAIQMGRLNGRADVWGARLPNRNEVQSALKGSDAVQTRTDGPRLVPLSGSSRLRKHVERLAELTDPESLETKNTEDAVNEFDERLAGAKAKATLISRVAGEDGDSTSVAANAAPKRLRGEGSEVEITRPSSERSTPTTSGKQPAPQKQSGEMEDFVGLTKVRKAI